MSESQNVYSPAKSISDYQLTYDRLVRMKADLEEIVRLGLVTGTGNDPDQEAIDTVQSWILSVRQNMKFLNP